MALGPPKRHNEWSVLLIFMGALKEPYTWSLPAETEPQSRHYNRGKLNVGCGVGASEMACGAMFEPFLERGSIIRAQRRLVGNLCSWQTDRRLRTDCRVPIHRPHQRS